MKNKINKVQVIIVAVLTACLSLAFFIVPDRIYSENENRTLQTAPEFSFESLGSGEYTTVLGDYFADQFPMRDGFIALKAYLELAQGKRENNGVIYASDDTLIPRNETEEERLEENLNSIFFFADNISAKVTVAPLPRVSDVFSERLPLYYPKEQDLLIWEEFRSLSEKLGIDALDVYDILCENNAYYRTDHHYTTEGAYLVYKALGEKLGFKPFSEKSFKKETVTQNFCGTSMRTSGFYMAKKDLIELYRYEGDADYDIVADGQKISLYDDVKAETTDKYAVFLGGNHRRVDISLKGEDRPKLLIVRDSFADSLVPFLARHFDITLIDLRYFTDSVSKVVKEEKIDKVLILENISEFAGARNLSYLRMN